MGLTGHIQIKTKKYAAGRFGCSADANIRKFRGRLKDRNRANNVNAARHREAQQEDERRTALPQRERAGQKTAMRKIRTAAARHCINCC